MVEGRKVGADNRSTYAARAMHDRVFSIDATTKKLVASDAIIWRSGNARVTVDYQQVHIGNTVAVIKADKAGMTYLVPKTDLAGKLTGLDGPRLGMTSALFGTTEAPKVGVALLSGSNTGDGKASQIRAVIWDQATNTLVDDGGFNGPPYDHLYSRNLGNNPAEKGRNFSSMDFIRNPFATGAAGEDAWLLIAATTGKPPEEAPSATCLDCAKKKLAAFITVVPVLETGPGGGSTTPPSDAGPEDGEGGGSNRGPEGGCSTGTGIGGAMALLIGIAAMRRRCRWPRDSVSTV